MEVHDTVKGQFTQHWDSLGELTLNGIIYLLCVVCSNLANMQASELVNVPHVWLHQEPHTDPQIVPLASL